MNEELRRAAELCDCTEALEYLCEYLDAEMPEGDLARLRAHIEGCEQCLEALASEKSLRVVLRRSCAEVAPESLRLRVISQLTTLRRSQ
ncbi:MAG TPA: mycothiol system anti-sigma-R factor [Beutenbergiaceae bacterium]|nr:mycothiol system anti-sigma-R factor [Beutenbergiaceae bacterium]